MSNRPLFEVKVLKQESLSDEVRLLWLPKLAAFKAGQMISIAISPDSPQRLYSICSGENDSHLAILYDIKKDGFLTPKLDGLSKEDKLWISLPFGSFTNFTKGSWLISTGTGLAPFYSLFKTDHNNIGRLIHGGREEHSFFFREELMKTLKERYTQCSSRGLSRDAYFGRVTDWLQKAELADPGTKYYLCGSAEMVVDTRDVLISRGVDYDNIISEIYF